MVTVEIKKYMVNEESQSISNVEVYAICKKLRELGVEIIDVFSDKIEFVWRDNICTYKNGAFDCGQVRFDCGPAKLNTEVLDELTSELTDEQLTRVGNLIDLFEDKYKHLLSQHEDMEYIVMEGTKLYRNNEQVLADYVNLIEQLQNTFQSGFLRSSFDDAVTAYILKGE